MNLHEYIVSVSVICTVYFNDSMLDSDSHIRHDVRIHRKRRNLASKLDSGFSASLTSAKPTRSAAFSDWGTNCGGRSNLSGSFLGNRNAYFNNLRAPNIAENFGYSPFVGMGILRSIIRELLAYWRHWCQSLNRFDLGLDPHESLDL